MAQRPLPNQDNINSDDKIQAIHDEKIDEGHRALQNRTSEWSNQPQSSSPTMEYQTSKFSNENRNCPGTTRTCQPHAESCCLFRKPPPPPNFEGKDYERRNDPGNTDYTGTTSQPQIKPQESPPPLPNNEGKDYERRNDPGNTDYTGTTSQPQIKPQESPPPLPNIEGKDYERRNDPGNTDYTGTTSQPQIQPQESPLPLPNIEGKDYERRNDPGNTDYTGTSSQPQIKSQESPPPPPNFEEKGYKRRNAIDNTKGTTLQPLYKPQSEPRPAPLDFVKRCLHTLLVLLWKHGIVRLKRYIATPLEFIIPGLFFFLLFAMMSLLEQIVRNEKFIETEIPLHQIIDPQLILYTPDNGFTKSLMKDVGESLNLNPLTYFPDSTSNGYYGFPEYTKSVIMLIEQLNYESAVVIFHDVDDLVTLPQKLTYTIAMRKRPFYDPLVKPEAPFSDILPPEGSDEMPELYMRIQWAIDSSFIQLLVNHENNLSVSRRADEFPLPMLSVSQYQINGQRTIMILVIIVCLKFISLVALFVPFAILMSTLIAERATGIQELMKQAGVSYSVWACSHGMNMIITGLFFSAIGTLVLYLNKNDISVLYTNLVYFFINFQLYFHSVLSFAFPLSFLSRNGEYAAATAIITYILIYVPSSFAMKLKEYPIGVRMLIGLLPHVPAHWFYMEVFYFEMAYKALEFGDLFNAHTKFGLSAFFAYLYMILQIILNMLLAEYLSNVAPGKFGVKKPLNYLCKKEEKAAATVLKQTEDERFKKDKRYFEDTKRPPSDVSEGIYVDRVTKIFGHNVVLSNVTFPVYKGEITILLGHNGAGKTTIMSIITGMLAPTRGRVLVNGVDVSRHRSRVKNSVGLCPQHNIFFQYLTCRQHVRFYAMLKGVSCKKAKLQATQLLQELGLGDKQSAIASTLSGGQKRRLQLACALTGNSKILILDEPTAGLDVETRRGLWDLLLSLRGTRTVLLSTHMMDEADALGDRVIALHRGQLKGHATPMYLKKNIGTGFRLSLTTDGFPDKEAITRVIQSVIPSATMKESSYNSVSYNLPSDKSHMFPELFSRLEKERENLKILATGVGVSSLEDVFLKLSSDVDTKFSKEDDDSHAREPQYHKKQGCPLYLRQMRELLKRHWRYLMFNKIAFIIQAIVSILIIAFLIYYYVSLSKTKLSKDNTGLENIVLSDMSSDEDPKKSKPHILYQDHPLTNNVSIMVRRSYSDVEFRSSKNVSKAIHRAVNFQLIKGFQIRDLYVIGVDLNDTDAKLSYSKYVRYLAPVALNLLSNILAAKRLSSADSKTIITYHQPLGGDKTKLDSLTKPKEMSELLLPIMLLISLIMSTASYSASLLTTEQESGVRHIHLISGCPPAVIWATALLFHTTLYTVIALIPATLFLLLDTGRLLSQPSYMFVFFVTVFVGLMASLVFFYAISFHLLKSSFAIFLMLIILLAGTIQGMIMFQVSDEKSDIHIFFEICATIFYHICPVATTTTAVLHATQKARLKKICNDNLNLCPELLPTLAKTVQGFDGKECCEEKASYMSASSMIVRPALMLLFAQFIFYSIIVLLTQYGVFNGLKDRIANSKYQPLPVSNTNKHVDAEKLYVHNQIQEPLSTLKEGQNAMLVSNLHKKYPGICKSLTAVRGINFSVKKGECFGLLGVNGAGKSSTFKMITAEEVVTRGKIYVNGHFLSCPRNSKYMKSLGYCPQFSGLDEFMTGQQNLNVVLVLRGLSDKDVNTETEAWIKVVGLERYRNILVANYSGGCMRRLATACALSSGGAVTLLDEPTAGVDVSARRRVWVALKKGLRSDRAVIITSHSMDEMEALCNRIAIMSAGEIGAFGSVPQLRAEFASGHALKIKINSRGPVGEELKNLKTAIEKTFECKLKDEHVTMLNYQINQKMHYSELFKKLEALKQAHPILEDYSVTETTLEEVFLSLAKSAQEEKPETSKGTKNRAKRAKRHPDKTCCL